jgi:hypothetical protein
MPLSFSKLEKLLVKKGLIPKKYFSIDGYIVYMEIFNIKNSDCFMVYIQSKYDISIDEHENNVYKIKYVDITEDGHIPNDYAGEIDENAVEEEIDIETKNNQYEDITEQLEEKYNRPISLTNTKQANDTIKLKEVFRQLRRLKSCTKNIKYKFVIMFSDYLCCIRRDDTYECFYISKFEGIADKKMMISIDLETLYENIDCLSDDIKMVKDSIYHIIEKNHVRHTEKIQKLLDINSKLGVFCDSIAKKKSKYSSYLSKLEQLLTDINIAEEKNNSKLKSIESKYLNRSNMNSEIEKIHQIQKYNNEQHRINVIKQDLIRNILLVKAKKENLSLTIDSVMFDNIIMIDSITKNFLKVSVV